MSIEQKISELLEESKKLEEEQIETSVEDTTEEIVAEETIEEETLEEGKKKKDMEEGIGDVAQKAVDVVKKVAGVATGTVGAATGALDGAVKGARRNYAATNEELAVDVSEDVAALVNGEELSEEFKSKAATIFEAAVVTRVKQEVAKLEEEYAQRIAEATEEIQEGLVEKIDGYLGLMVEQWMEQNALALESGMKSDILESFVGGMKSLFEEHYIDIPEEKYDVLGEMETRVEELESKLNESVESSVELKKELDAIKRVQAIEESTEGLTDTEVEKFRGLAEELSYEDVESFKTKLQTIRENYFVTKANADVKSVVTDEPIVEQKVLNETISRYVQALGKTTFR